MTKQKVLFFGIQYAVDSYLPEHISVLKTIFNVESFFVDSLPGYNRRSFLTFPSELFLCYQYLFSSRPDYIVSVGPKPGLIAAALALMIGAKHIHWFTGQQWCLSRCFFIQPSYICDLIINIFSYKSLSDSPTQAGYLYDKLPVLLRRQIYTLPQGSISSVCDTLFEIYNKRSIHSDPFSSRRKIAIGFLGRLCFDKGLATLCDIISSFDSLLDIEFFICGPLDSSLSTTNAFDDSKCQIDFLKSQPNVTLIAEYVPRTVFFKSIDIFLMPSLREGFCLTVVEAQAAGIPVVCSDIYGLFDSTLPFSGAIRCSSIEDYTDSIKLLCDPYLYRIFSCRAHSFALKFAADVFRPQLLALYSQFLLSS